MCKTHSHLRSKAKRQISVEILDQRGNSGRTENPPVAACVLGAHYCNCWFSCGSRGASGAPRSRSTFKELAALINSLFMGFSFFFPAQQSNDPNPLAVYPLLLSRGAFMLLRAVWSFEPGWRNELCVGMKTGRHQERDLFPPEPPWWRPRLCFD